MASKTTSDLRDTLFRAIDHLNIGELEARDAKVISDLAGKIIASAKLDLAAAVLNKESPGRRVRPLALTKDD